MCPLDFESKRTDTRRAAERFRRRPARRVVLAGSSNSELVKRTRTEIVQVETFARLTAAREGTQIGLPVRQFASINFLLPSLALLASCWRCSRGIANSEQRTARAGQVPSRRAKKYLQVRCTLSVGEQFQPRAGGSNSLTSI